MSLATLSNLSVPTDGANAPMLMPKLQYRFRVKFVSFGNSTDNPTLTREVVDATRPNLSFEQIVLDSYNSKSYLAGKPTWDPVTITVRDDANNGVQRLVGKQLQKQFDFYEQSSASSGGVYKFETYIEILDGGNGANPVTVIDKFHLVGCYLESVNYNSLNYATNDPVTLSLNIRYDNAVQYTGDSASPVGIGDQTVDRNTGFGVSV